MEESFITEWSTTLNQPFLTTAVRNFLRLRPTLRW